MPDRRTMLRIAGACCVAGLRPMAPRALVAAAPTSKRLVVVLLRGAMDGLGTVPAYADPAYVAARGSLALGGNDSLVDLDGFFALHPALPTLAGWYREGSLTVLHAVATPYRERSHFDGQDLLESGTAHPGGSGSGWLNRALALMGAEGRRVGLAVGPTVPLLLRGEAPVTTWAPRALPPLDAEFLERLSALYAGDPALGPAFAQGLEGRAQAAAAGVDDRGGRAGRAFAFRSLATEIGKLLAAEQGMRVAALELGGWDTHAGQGTVEGRLARALGGLDAGLAALRRALGPAWAETALVVMTEFGRTVAANGSGGTDHGTAGAAFLAGGAVRGGRVVAQWPGLAPGRLFQGRDLAPTLDLRAPLKAALRDHLGLPADGIERLVFPGSVDVRPSADLFGA